jgi:hypothetical protein
MNILWSFNLCAKKRIMRLYLRGALFLMLLSAGQLSAQTDTSILSFDIPKDDSENLNVLRQWIKWNNPGSLLVQHLSGQASNYYNSRDKQIAQIKTRPTGRTGNQSLLRKSITYWETSRRRLR